MIFSILDSNKTDLSFEHSSFESFLKIGVTFAVLSLSGKNLKRKKNWKFQKDDWK